MKDHTSRRTFLIALALALCAASLPLYAAIQLAPVVSSGLSSPLFAGHAGDGSGRLFIVERGGIVKVLQPGSSAPTTFLDIDAKVLSGGERGLLGLAFHPQYENNGRFFVYYTRDAAASAGDGDLVISELGVSSDPNVAATAETVLLTIEHSSAGNHNGGMIAFGPDGYLYAGIGDGGGGNDPPDNAQNLDTLLGKILRIDVDSPDGNAGTLYSAPPDNPYVGVAGRDEIFSIGWRNPWRFSFDRDTGQLWVADVGQGAREEVDTPIENGGNYGWRPYEGSACTGIDPQDCVPSNYLFPVFDYTHSGGRCSITGGYVYRGAQNALPLGTYVYGDYCSGEIFSWNGSTQTVSLATPFAISSFGEDEEGELYVVDLDGGGVSRIVTTTPCAFDIDPSGQGFGASGGSGTVAVSAGAGCSWSAVANRPWIHVTSGGGGNGSGNVGYRVDANPSASSRSGTMTIAGRTFTVDQGGAAPGAPCSVVLSPVSASYGGEGGRASVEVTARAGCNWTARSKVGWITIAGGANGSGAGSVSYSVAVHNGRRNRRTGRLIIAGQAFVVTQTRNNG